MSYSPSNEFYAEVAKGNISGHSIVNKFGRNAGVPNGSFELVSSLSAVYAGFLAAATTVRIKAGGHADDTAAGVGAQSVFVEGITDGLIRGVEEIATAGASASAATTTLFWRIDRVYVGDAGTYATPVNTAAITIENSGGGIDLIQIDAGEGQSQHCAIAVPDATTAYLVGYELTADASNAADFRLFVRANLDVVAAPVSPMRLKRYWDGVLGALPRDLELPSRLVAGPADIWVEAQGGGTGTEVSVALDVLLVAD